MQCLSPGADMRRRELLRMLGGAAATLPLTASAQQPSPPVIGLLDTRSSDEMAGRLAGFRLGLKEVGFTEGENVRIVYRWAENRADRLPHMATELVREQAAVIFSTGGPLAPFAAKAATTTIPIVFLVGEDPAQLGLVSSLARPTGNLTGINLFANELEAKRLELLHELIPQAVRIAVFVNPGDVRYTENTLEHVGNAARARGMQVRVLRTRTPREIDEAFTTFTEDRPDAVFIGAAPFLNARRVQLSQLAAFHRLPATYTFRDSVEAGGLMSYGPSIFDAYRQSGIYAGRLLRGAKPSDLPVMQVSKFELAINLRTARLLGLTVPQALLATADEVID
jgi:putative tryptophan/tyrosine transport system substrate-binding protein